MSATVRYERRGAAALLTIDRPERRNAVDGETAAQLLEGLRAFEADDEARGLVLTGAGELAFCAGADLKALETLGDPPEGPMGFTRVQASKPTVAAISGWCVAGGLELALWCDLRIAAAGSTLGFTERRWGVPLIDGGTQRLPAVVGAGRALQLVLTGRMVEVDEALAMGLVNEVTQPGDHLERALELVESLAAFPQDTMLSDREALLRGLGLPLQQGLELERSLGAGVLETARAGAARFAAGAGRHGEDAGP